MALGVRATPVVRSGTLAAPALLTAVGLQHDHGFLAFDLQWFPGHHLPGYSLVFPPLGELVGPRVLGAAAAVASAALFALLAAGHWGIGARAGVLWFAAATLTELMIGRLTFALGVAVGLGALLALQRGRPRLAGALAAGCAVSSPVAGLLLAMAGLALGLGERRGDGLWLAATAFVPAVLVAVAFPEGGRQPFGGVAAAFVLPTPMGSNATRLLALFGGPLLLCALNGRGIGRRALVALLAFLVAYQWYGPLRELAKGAVDPSGRADYHRPLVEFLDRRLAAGQRVHVPSPRLHWEAVWVARSHPLARGWETQLDVKHNGVLRRRASPRPPTGAGSRNGASA